MNLCFVSDEENFENGFIAAKSSKEAEKTYVEENGMDGDEGIKSILIGEISNELIEKYKITEPGYVSSEIAKDFGGEIYADEIYEELKDDDDDDLPDMIIFNPGKDDEKICVLGIMDNWVAKGRKNQETINDLNEIFNGGRPDGFDVDKILHSLVYTIGFSRVPMVVPEDQWIRCAKKLMAEEGVDLFLSKVINELRSNFEGLIKMAVADEKKRIKSN